MVVFFKWVVLSGNLDYVMLGKVYYVIVFYFGKGVVCDEVEVVKWF